MQKVTISKSKLLNELKKNREEHKLIYEDAIKCWKERVIAELGEALEDAKNDLDYITYFDIEKPESHIEDYNEIIDRVSWHEEAKIELDVREFNMFVRDKWDWMPSFLNTSHFYTSSSSSSSSGSSTIASVSRDLISKKMKKLGVKF